MDTELFGKIGREIERLKEENIPVIVEGSNDRKALEELGLSNIIILKGKPLYKLVESIDVKEVAVLTDLDEEGKKMYHELRQEFSTRGVMINDKLRVLLFKTQLRQIEGLANYLERNK
ncbi:MAG: toprim domain-containing protein [Candidatus Nanoarchaeia archaeon]|nr:toprim domain-containing protein [Candidatus Nanoarchaeia archaeon]